MKLKGLNIMNNEISKLSVASRLNKSCINNMIATGEITGEMVTVKLSIAELVYYLSRHLVKNGGDLVELKNSVLENTINYRTFKHNHNQLNDINGIHHIDDKYIKLAINIAYDEQKGIDILGDSVNEIQEAIFYSVF